MLSYFFFSEEVIEKCVMCEEFTTAKLVEVPGKFRLLKINRTTDDNRKNKTKLLMNGMEVLSFIMHKGYTS